MYLYLILNKICFNNNKLIIIYYIYYLLYNIFFLMPNFCNFKNYSLFLKLFFHFSNLFITIKLFVFLVFNFKNS